MDKLTQIKMNRIRTESQKGLRKAVKELGLGHGDLKTIAKKLDEDLLNARNMQELTILTEFTEHLIIYMKLI